MPRVVAAILLCVCGAAGAQTAALDDVLSCMSANVPQAARVQAIEVTSYDRAGQGRMLRGRVFGSRANDRAQVMARVEAPGDLAGAAFLVREGSSAAEMYTYLPSVNRVKRIAANTMNGRLWGTDFSYNEFRQVATAFGGGATTLEGATDVGGRPAHRLKLVPGAGDGQPYASIEILVDRQTCVPLRAEFRDATRARKVLVAEPAQLQRAGSHWYAGEMTLSDLVAGTRTHLKVIGVAAASALSASYFHPQQFYSAR